jgi:hypothetical protein
VGWGNPADLLMGDATSRLLLQAAGDDDDAECPAGVDALVTVHVLAGSPPEASEPVG